MIKKIFKKQRGFTVLETIVAISVLSLSISGVFSAVQQSLSQSIISKDEVKVFYLAQEAVDIIRNKRDSNQLSKTKGLPVSWLDGITQGGDGVHICPFGHTCTVNAVDLQIVDCGTGGWGTCPVLNQDPTTFLYSYNTSYPATNFRREIQIESIDAKEIAITVQISWSKGSLPLRFKVKTLLLNWI
jgi:prepilin-type N-terminal cleavage/methylation domain-containing protein